MADLKDQTNGHRLLAFVPTDEGGLADYAFAQLNALAERNVAVTALCRRPFAERPSRYFEALSLLKEPWAASSSLPKPLRALRYASEILSSHNKLAKVIRDLRFRHVLFSAYAEYFSPIWAPWFLNLRSQGVRFGAIVHDPVRDFVRGPRQWHEYSVKAAYSFLDIAFVHSVSWPQGSEENQQLRTVTIPHGLFEFRTNLPSKAEARTKYALPEDARVFLAFGHIRDGKNLDRVLHALREVPEAYLLVAGREQSAGQRPATFYQAMARDMGIWERTRWDLRFIPECETGEIFAAADFLVLTYSGDFRSASGVLAAAAAFRKPCLVSSGDGPLTDDVRKYDLGVVVEPDSTDALTRGAKLLLQSRLEPRWDDYCRDHSWDANAEIVIRALFNDRAL